MGRNMVVIGATGTGKSTLCNVLAGQDPDDATFPVSEKMSSCTFATTSKPVRWMAKDFRFNLIDTPGLDDPEGKDSQHISDMVDALKAVKFVNTFLIVFNGQQPRLDHSLKAMLKIFQGMFGPGFLNNTVIQFSRWSFDKSSKRRRQRANLTEQSQHAELNRKFREEGLGLNGKDVPTVFIDSHYDPDDDGEKEAFKQETNKLKKLLETLPAYECKDFQAVQTELDKTKKDLEKKEKEAKKAAEDARKAMVAKAGDLDLSWLSNMAATRRQSQDEMAVFFSKGLQDLRRFTIIIDHELPDARTKFTGDKTIVQRLMDVTKQINQNLRKASKKSKEIDNIITQELQFCVIKEKVVKERKEDATKKLKQSEIDVKRAKEDIERTKNDIELAREGVKTAEEALADAKKKRDDAKLALILTSIFTGGIGAAITGPIYAQAESTVNDAHGHLKNMEGVLDTGYKYQQCIKNLGQIYEKSLKSIVQAQMDLSKSLAQVKIEQKRIAGLVTKAKQCVTVFNMTWGKTQVLQAEAKNTSFLEPLINILRDIVTYLQADTPKKIITDQELLGLQAASNALITKKMKSIIDSIPDWRVDTLAIDWV